MFICPILISPYDGTYILRSSFKRVDFPHPLSPTMAVTFPSGIVKFIFFKTMGACGEYLNDKFFTIKLLSLGKARLLEMMGDVSSSSSNL